VQIPASSDLLAEVKIPLCLVVCPLAEIIEDREQGVAVVDAGADGPMRCLKCKAYVNPFMRFVENGAKFICNFCGNMSDGSVTPRAVVLRP
jgi:protein transport protein SEC24